MAPPVFILDNGASTIKCGFAQLNPKPRLIPNRVARLTKGFRQLFIADELEKCTAWEDLHWRVPFERGILTNWDIEKVVWDRVFSPAVMNVDPRELSLLVTEPPLNLPNVAASYDQMVFEEYEFASYFRCTSAALIPHGKLYGPKMPDAAILVESGHSFTHVTPLLRGVPVPAGIRRIDIGGNMMTNHLKTILSFRQFEMMDLGWVVQDIKHRLCYVSQDFKADIEAAHITQSKGADGKIPPNPLSRSYVLPDLAAEMLGHSLPTGRARSPTHPDHPTVSLTNERFSIPELLFHPSNIGLPQAGLAECVQQAIAALPEEARALAWYNIGVIGGSTMFNGFCQRLESEIRRRAPTHFRVVIHQAEDPITCTYTSAVPFAQSRQYHQLAVTKQQYEEVGSSGLRRLLAGDKRASLTPVPASSKRKAELLEEDEDEEDGAHATEEEDEEEVVPKRAKARAGRRVSGAGRAGIGKKKSASASGSGTPLPPTPAPAPIPLAAHGRQTRSRAKAG
ncbi:actin-domain-containing protein [Dacryopinax primogenitus]|uniref:Actin-like protein ARP6 n=1 Tax=Dacryopinax primogenitus (strain DJM 731) TaxID=1858805 RepID=M5G6C9_DACPD|nr:actin-domain-containing protein [Dacryopinax primogenitus]EJT99322.1 actin-domain-containing protein [Dacryopinax primogenitus]